MLVQKDELLKQFVTETDVFIKSKLLESLIRDAGMRVGDIAQSTNLKPSYLSHLRRIARIPDSVYDGYYNNLISASHLFILSRLKNDKDIVAAYEKILENNLSAVATEILIREKLYGIKKKGEYLSAEEKKRLVQHISDEYGGAELDIMQSRIKSKIMITLKGDLDKTGRALRKILEKLA